MLGYIAYTAKKPGGIIFYHYFACWGLGRLVDTGESFGELLRGNAQCCEDRFYKFQIFSNDFYY